MSYPIGVDLGATYTAAAVYLPERVEVASLGVRAAFIPTVAAVAPDGALVFAENVTALSGLDRVARQFIRRVGDDTPLLLGDVSITAEALTARFVSFVVGAVTAESGGLAPPTAITHPASWGSYRVAALRSALSAEGLGATVLLSGPQASARAYADHTPVAAGELVAVYDLGGSGLDAAVVRRSADGEFILAGRAEEVEVGGLDFDELVFEHVRTALGEQWNALDGNDPVVLAGVAQLRRACTAAKERLSTDTEAWIPVAIPGISAGGDGAVRLVRAELEEMIQPALEESATVLLRAITSAGAGPDDLAAVLLTGGSSRIPLVTQVVSEVLGRPVTVAEQPKAETVIGAALAAARHTATVADALAQVDIPAELATEPTLVMPRVVPDLPEYEPSPTYRGTSPPAPPLAAALGAPGLPVQRRRQYALPGLLAWGGMGLAALLAGGWMWMSNVEPPGVDANVKGPVADRTAPPSSVSPVKSPSPDRSLSRAQPNMVRMRPSPRPAASSHVPPTGPARSPTPTAPPQPVGSSTPPQPATSTTAPSPSTSPSPSRSGGLLPWPYLNRLE